MRVIGLLVGLMLLVALVIGGLFVLPTYMMKHGLDQMIASLPAGTKFTYGSAKYALLGRELTLHDAAIELENTHSVITIGDVHIMGGNAHLQDAVNHAIAAPGLNDETDTDMADNLVFDRVHFVQAPMDLAIDHVEIKNPRLRLAEIMAQLPPSAALAGNLPPEAADVLGALQKIGLAMTATAYDRAKIVNAALSVSQGQGGGALAELRFGTIEIDGFDHGNFANSSMTAFSVRLSALSLLVDAGQTGATSQRDFWLAVRDGGQITDVLQKLSGADQSITGVHFREGAQQIFGVGSFSSSGVKYLNGLPVAMDLAVKDFTVDMTAVPDPTIRALASDLNYPTITAQADFDYTYDPAKMSAEIRKADFDLADGGDLAVTGAFDNPGGFANGSLETALVDRGTMRYEDHSLFGRLLAMQAKQSGQSAQAMQTAYVNTLESLKPNADPVAAGNIASLEAFVQSPHVLIVTFSPAGPLKIGDLRQMNAAQFLGMAGLKIATE